MKNLKESLHIRHRWWYYPWMITVFTVTLLMFPVKAEASDPSREDATGYTIVIEQKNGTDRPATEQPERTKNSMEKNVGRQVREEEVRHVLGIAIAGIGIIWGGLIVAVYKVRQNRADEVYLQRLRELYETETQTEISSETVNLHKAKVKYDRAELFVQRKQA